MVWPFGSCLHFAIIGLLGLAVAAVGGEWRGLSWHRAVGLGSAGVCVITVPAAVLQIVSAAVPELTSVAVFCAVPLMTVLAASALSRTAEGTQLLALMVPSIIGLGGALLLFPVRPPGELRGWTSLGLVLACCIVVAIASVWMHRQMQGVSVAAALGLIGLGSAAVLACYAFTLGWPALTARVVTTEALRCVAFDLPLVWLLVWLTREIAPARLSARFLLVPLVTLLETYALERGPVDARTIVAVVLLCAGGAMLLFKDEPDEIPGLRLQ